MGQDYRHFSLEERCTIASLRAAGRSIRQIAAVMDRAASSISRELRRNAGAQDYKPSYAGEQARHGDGQAQSLTAMRPCDLSCWRVCVIACHQNRLPGVWRVKQEPLSSAMRPSTASSMPRSPATTTSPGGVTCPAPRLAVVGADVKVEAR